MSCTEAAKPGLAADTAPPAADPLVNLSTRSQVAAKQDKQVRSAALGVQGAADLRGEQTTLAAALKVIKEDGVAALYDGLTSSLLGIAVTNGCVSILYRREES